MTKPPPGSDETVKPADWPGVPGYEIIGELGRGGMGVVLEARQLSSGERVALKLIRDGALAGPQDRARFRIEAAAAARMDHPNIVKIHEVGEHEGRPYFAMELIGGGSLDKLLAAQPQPAHPAAELIRTLAHAVQHAHMQKIIHRDLKPANILMQSGAVSGGVDPLTTHDSPLTNHSPKITDFGLAKRLDSDSTAWTRDGDILGTASYMAPEQAAGRVADIGPGVDVYALGAMLYEMLTGRPPFHGETWNETVQQVLHEEAAPPTRFRADLPRDLESVCLKCLEKTPDRRYLSAADLADDLSRFLDAQPVAAVPLDAHERLKRRAERDGYHIVGEAGRRPRSIVYHALYNPLKQPVAVKVFDTGFCTRDEWEARLQAAGDVWATLTHPHLVPVQRAGWWDDAPYVVVEYVPHGSLTDALAGKPYPIVQGLGLAEQLVEIVSYLHRQGVVHGNLKPSNVLLAANGIPRVVDLRLTSGLLPSVPAVDATDCAGLAYLAPELAGDPKAEPRPTADMYGLGLILYELLTGRPPFAATTGSELLEQVRSQEPLPPSRFNADVKPHLDAFCLRCLRKNPWRRFERVYALLGQLRMFRDELSQRGAPEKSRPRRRPPRMA